MHRGGWRLNNWNVRFGSKADICGAQWHVRFTPESDIECDRWNVRFGPEADILRRNGNALFDHLVGAREQRRWYHQAKRLSRFKIDR
jgi:hypothetical protein